MRSNSGLARRLASLLKADFVLADVGCSGGVDPGWRSLTPHIRAFGFDLVAEEVARLNASETEAKFRYFCANIGLPEQHPLLLARGQASYWRRNPWANLAVYMALERDADWRSSVPAVEQNLTHLRGFEQTVAACTEEGLAAWREQARNETRGSIDAGSGAAEAASAPISDEMRENRWHQSPNLSREPITLGRALNAAGIEHVDFLKIDIDGGDYEALFSLSGKFAELGIMGLGVEVNFFGSDTSHHNSFHNVDRLLRSEGFVLFDLSMRRYSASALPGPFITGYPAQSAFGRILQGDALYVRDPYMSVEGFKGTELSADQALKFAIIFSLFRLPDQAADVLLRRVDLLEAEGVNVPELLDALAGEALEGSGYSWTYDEYIQAFRDQHPWFYGRTPEPAEPVRENAEVAAVPETLPPVEARTLWSRVSETIRSW